MARGILEGGIVTAKPNSKLKSASSLILGIEALGVLSITGRVLMEIGFDASSLREVPADPEELVEVVPEELLKAAMDRQRLAAGLTRVVLYAIVVELVVKHLWEEEHGTNAKYTHNIHKLFGELEPETQEQIRAIYDECCREYDAAVQAGRQQLGHEAVAVKMANLEEALQWNEQAIKDFKYDLTPRGKSVPTGMFWDSNTYWVLSSKFKNFAVEVTDWASHRGTGTPS